MVISMEYQKELFRQQTPYLQWLTQQQKQLSEIYGDKKVIGEQIKLLPFCSCEEKLERIVKQTELNNNKEDIYLFINKAGFLNNHASEVISEYFKQYPQTAVLYTDEDYAGTLYELYGINEGELKEDILSDYYECRTECKRFRGEPWFKPDYSPDTLKSFFYFGNIFAVNGDMLYAAYKENISIYELMLSIAQLAIKNNRIIAHLPKVLFTNKYLVTKQELYGFKIPNIQIDSLNEKMQISIIIPSKDNSEVIERCLTTLIKYTKYTDYELIIVDNGSCEAEKQYREELFNRLKKDYKGLKITNIYDKQDFNFSKMCNVGAKAAKGEYLLFLNDDIEFYENDNWLYTMLLQAQNTHTGAVGAKLYYPGKEGESYKIQHAGITNMGIGPAHKLGGMEDIENLYHGHNIAVYNMIAVTAACMMIKKEKFELVGGFDEELAVAYNDVELCFKLYEKGLFNVVRNDVAIIHHESLTRGQDTSAEKQQRLLHEKQLLYKKHPKLFATDPFYNKNLVQWKRDAEYNTGFLFECDKEIIPQKLDFDDIKTLPYEYKNKLMRKIAGQNLLMIEIDTVEEESIVESNNEKQYFIIKGWSVVRNSDNSQFDKTLLLRRTDEPDKEIYSLKIQPQLRKDVEMLFVNEANVTQNTALSGIHVIFEQTKILSGIYEIGILMKKSNKRYIKWTDRTVTINT